MRSSSLLYLFSLGVAMASAALDPRQLNVDAPPDVPATREYFYTGGGYEDDGTGTGQHIFTGQMYVEQLTPVSGVKKPYPIIFIHGQAQTGTNWLNKPDGGRGWASFFLNQGFEIYIIDQTLRARSAARPVNGSQTTYSAEIIQQRFTAPERYNLWPQAKLHTRWNGTGVMGDPIFDAYYASNVQFIRSATQQQSTVQKAGAALLDRIGKPVILLSHSQGGLMPWVIADVRPQLTKAIVSLEPTGPPFQEAIFTTTAARPYGLTDIPIIYSPNVTDPAKDLVKQTIPAPSSDFTSCTIQADNPPPRKLVNLSKVPVLVVTTEASYHVPYDWCTVKYLQQAGVNTTHWNLGDFGIHGNGHLVFMEKNSDQVAQLLQGWIGQFT